MQHSSLFSVEIPIPPILRAAASLTGGALTNTADNLKFYCLSAGVPGMQLATSQIRRYGYGPIEEKPFLPIFAPVDMRFIADGKGAIWNYFDLWIKSIVNHDARFGINTATGLAYNGNELGGFVSGTAYPYELNYKRDYAVDVKIKLYDPTGKNTLSIILREAFPKFMGDSNLHWGDSNNMVLIPIQFTFIDWYNVVLVNDGSISESELSETFGAINSLNINDNTKLLSQSEILNYSNSILNKIQNR